MGTTTTTTTTTITITTTITWATPTTKRFFLVLGVSYGFWHEKLLTKTFCKEGKLKLVERADNSKDIEKHTNCGLFFIDIVICSFIDFVVIVIIISYLYQISNISVCI